MTFSIPPLCVVLLWAATISVPALAQEKAQPGTKPAAKPAGQPVRVAQAKSITLSNDITAVGTLLANETVMIRPEVAGRVVAINFNEGQAIATGARLISLDAAEVNAQLEGSRADERLSKQRADRSGELFSKNFISQQALDDAREAYRKAAARRQEDEVRLAKTEIRAPFSGVAGLRLVSVGAYLKAGEDIVRIDKIDVMKLDFRVPELYLGKITRDQQVNVRVDAFPEQQFDGKVYAVETSIDEKTRTVMLRARVANLGMRLRPGMFARVQLELSAKAGAIIVPEQAIVPRGDKYFVFRVNAGKVDLIEVFLGSRRPGEVEIVKGLAAGDTVVTDGQLKLQPGVSVMVVADKPAPAAPASADKK